MELLDGRVRKLPRELGQTVEIELRDAAVSSQMEVRSTPRRLEGGELYDVAELNSMLPAALGKAEKVPNELRDLAKEIS